MEYLLDESMVRRLGRLLRSADGEADLRDLLNDTPQGMPFDRHGIAWLKNTSGTDREAYDILGIDASDIDPATAENDFKVRIAIQGVTPTASHRGKFAVLLEAIADDAYGWAMISGTVQARVNIVDEHHHDWADVDAANPTRLLSRGGGAAQILQQPSGTGEKWCIVRLGPPGYSEFWGVLDEALAADDSAAFSVYDISSTETDTNNNITVYAPPVLRSGSVAEDKWGAARWSLEADKWIFRDAEC